MSVAPSPAANPAAATAPPDALASAEEGLLSRSASLGLATPLPVRSAPAPLQRHDPDMDDEEGDRAGGDAGSEGLDADAEAEADAAAAEAADFDCAEKWRGDAGGDSGGGASADRYRAAGDDGAAATPPWAAVQLDCADGKNAELPRPPGSDPGAGTGRAPASSTWLYRGCGRARMQFGDPVTLQCQHGAERQAGCCWHTAGLHTVLILPHSRCACPQHGVHPIGRGLGRYDDVNAATTPAATSSRVPR